jgi:hypothetical protein
MKKTDLFTLHAFVLMVIGVATGVALTHTNEDTGDYVNDPVTVILIGAVASLLFIITMILSARASDTVYPYAMTVGPDPIADELERTDPGLGEIVSISNLPTQPERKPVTDKPGEDIVGSLPSWTLPNPVPKTDTVTVTPMREYPDTAAELA